MSLGAKADSLIKALLKVKGMSKVVKCIWKAKELVDKADEAEKPLDKRRLYKEGWKALKELTGDKGDFLKRTVKGEAR